MLVKETASESEAKVKIAIIWWICAVRWLTRVPRVREVESSFPKGRAKSYSALETVRHRFNIYAGSCVALALWRGDGHRQVVTHLGVIRRVEWKVGLGCSVWHTKKLEAD